MVIGLDIGTTGTKAIVFDEKGGVYGRGYMEYSIVTAPGGCVTQCAADWKAAVIHSVNEACSGIDRSQITAIGISAQGSSLAADKSISDAGTVYTWMDNRAAKEARYLEKSIGGEEMYRKFGWPVSAWGDAAKILWLKNNRVLSGGEKFISTLSYINYFLTGRFVSDPTNSAIRQLYNITEMQYDRQVLSVLGITEDSLPEVLPTGALVGTLNTHAAGLLGLDTSVRVYNGAHDQYCAALGCGAVSPGDIMLATGTTWIVLGITEKPVYTESHICPGIHPAGGYGALASQVNAGSALKWWHEQTSDSYKTFDDEAEKRRESSAQLFWIPYLAGSGFPDNDPEKRSVISGLSLYNDKYDMARALMEGVVFEAKRVLAVFDKTGMKSRRLFISGGATVSRFWMGIVCACLDDYEIYFSKCADAACAGAAMLAETGIGAFANLKQAAANMTGVVAADKPSASDIDYYKKKFADYIKLLEKENGK